MTAAEADTREGTEIERIERWRAEALERAGYGPRAAASSPGGSTSTCTSRATCSRRAARQELALQILI